jgi:hypothetical protein
MTGCHVCGDTSEKQFLSKVNLVYKSEYDFVECSSCGVIFFQPPAYDGTVRDILFRVVLMISTKDAEKESE